MPQKATSRSLDKKIKMKSQLFQWNFTINGLIPDPIKLKRKVWLKKGELLLEKSGDTLNAYLLGNEDERFRNEEIITSYLRISCLISSNKPKLQGGGGFSLKSANEFGHPPKYKLFITKLRQHIPEPLALEAGDHAHKFIEFIGKLHDKYVNTINENPFISLALNFYYEAEKQSTYTNEGFISISICMESLFNEGQSDISYKLALRASFLLGLCGINPIEANGHLKKFYNTRSKIVHGAGTISHDSNEHHFAEYARLSTIAFLILLSSPKRMSTKKTERKIEILKEIDYAMLSESGRKLLKMELTKGLRNFRLPTPRVFEQKIGTHNHRISPW